MIDSISQRLKGFVAECNHETAQPVFTITRCVEYGEHVLGVLTTPTQSIEYYTLERKSFIIPTDTYLCQNTWSQKFSNKEPYKNFYGKFVPLIYVAGRSGIRIHVGNFITDTTGCVLVGCEVDNKGDLLFSRDAYKGLMTYLQDILGPRNTYKIKITQSERYAIL